MLHHRPATDLDDLRAAGALMSRAWRSGAHSVVPSATGLEWWYASSWPDALADHLRLWTEGGDLVAWTWHDAGEIEWSAWTGQPARDVAALEGIVETVIAEHPDAPVALWSAEDDDPTLGVFAHHGFVAAGRRLVEERFSDREAARRLLDLVRTRFGANSGI